MEDLYIPNCCIAKQLPALLRQHEGRMAVFYSQGDWGITKLWSAVSHLVSNTVQTTEGTLKPTGGKIEVLLVVATLDDKISEIVTEYLRRGWYSHLMLVCYSTVLQPDTLQSYIEQWGGSVTLITGRREAQRQSLWLRYDDVTYSSLLITGPIYSKDQNNPFGQYTATFFDQPADGYFSEGGKQLVEMTTRAWLHISNFVRARRR